LQLTLGVNGGCSGITRVVVVVVVVAMLWPELDFKTS